MDRCPSCNGEFDEGASFCTHCGADLTHSVLVNPVCPVCGETYPGGTSLCEKDGTKLVEAERMVPKCVVCGREFRDGTKFCPADGGAVIPEGRRKRAPSPFDTGRKLSEEEEKGLVEREYDVKTKEYLRKGWEMFREHAAQFMGYSAVVILINFFLGFIPFLGHIASAALIAPLTGGFFYVIFKIMKGQKTEFPNFFMGFTFFLPLLLSGLLIGFFTAVGFILLIIPGIYLSVCYLFTSPLIIDRELDFWQAMEGSRKIVTRKWFDLALFSGVLFLINLGGTLFFVVGLVFTIPFSFCVLSAAYEDIVGIETAYF